MSLAGLTVLVVEDEPIIALDLEDLLTDAGATPVVAGSLAAAAEVMAKQSIDRAILDVNVSGRKSYDLARELTGRGIGFVFASGYGDAVHPPEFAGVPTITKPYGLTEIEEGFAALD